MKKIIYFIYDFLTPNFIKNIIKFIIIKRKYKCNIWKNTLNILGIKYLMSWKMILWKEVNLWNWNIISWYIDIWDYSYINSPNTKLAWSDEYKIKIWKFCSISWWVQIITNNFHHKNKLTTSDHQIIHNLNKNNWWDINIWNDVWIWCNAIILQWITIWNWAIIWAWSIVTKDIPAYAIAVWNPAKIIDYRFNKETILNLENIKWWNWKIEKIKENYNLNFLNK